ncbi:MAG: sulfotransferase [Trichodesmium sp. St5_bin2_1]|jgi:hypothetical protein|nr:sulfotransferase [Trichodesmium sp. St5_bin2_1]
MMMPNFLIIGATKAGTTSLYNYLKQHPQIYMSPVKEPRFFAFEGENTPHFLGYDGKQQRWTVITEIEDYQALFRGVSDEIAIGEASTLYLYSPKAPERIRYHIPDVKVIAILRDPVERAYSHFLHFVRSSHEPFSDFLQAFQDEENRIQKNLGMLWHYKNMGFYSVQISRYFKVFDRANIKVYLYEDWNNDPLRFLEEIFSFLGVDSTFVPDMSLRSNPSVIPKNPALQKFLLYPNFLRSFLKFFLPKKLRQGISLTLYKENIKNGFKPPLLSDNVREELIEVYRDDIWKLQDLINRDLSMWLKT